MSYRELRNFTEMMRSLGYPRLLSVENFRSPNFRLVAEILDWIMKRYEPNNDAISALDTEQDRIIFIKSAALFIMQKARIRLNPKKLYQAEGYAIQELTSVVRVLYDANRQQLSIDDTEPTLSSIRALINTKLGDMRTSRQLAARIPESGATLYDLLGKEVQLKEQRTTALARPLQLADVEKGLRSSIVAVQEETKQLTNSLNNISSDEATLDAKIEKRRNDYDRQQKRFAQLQTVRPAYMDEFDKLETRLKEMYALYVLKFRNLSHLEQVQNEFERTERERSMEAEQSMRKLVETMRDDERRRLIDAEKLETGADDDDAINGVPLNIGKSAPKVYGNITGAGLSDDDGEFDENSLLSDGDDDDDVISAVQQDIHTESMATKAAPASSADFRELMMMEDNELSDDADAGDEAVMVAAGVGSVDTPADEDEGAAAIAESSGDDF